MSAWRRLRQNHALEHAAVAVAVQRRGHRFPVIGISDPTGFVLAARFSDGEAENAVHEAFRRLDAGERWLAITDDCGTTLLASGILTALTVLGLAGRRPLANLPRAVFGAIILGRFTQRLGRDLQRNVTVEPDLAGIDITRVRKLSLPNGWTLIRVSTGAS